MNSAQSDLWLGRLIGDRRRYRLDRLLGRGGTADVFLATDTLLGQPVAVKLLHDRLLTGDVRARFEREATLCAALKNEHIVQVSDYGATPEGYPFFVMEYLHGQTLRTLLRCEKRLPLARTVSIVTQVCAGLHLAHQGVDLWQEGATVGEHVKIIHRDLKPDNIFLIPTALGELVKILDFGIAKIHGEQAAQTNTTTAFLGTYRYAAPEQFDTEKDLDERADIYSLGMVIYEMLSGTDPFGFKAASRPVSGGNWAIAHMTKSPLPLRQQEGCETIPSALEAVVMQCLQKAPNQRFASVYELHQALKAAVSAESSAEFTMIHPLKDKTITPIDPSSPSGIEPTQLFSSHPIIDAVTHNITSILSTAAGSSLSHSFSFSSRKWPQQVGIVFLIATTAAIGLSYWSYDSSFSNTLSEQKRLAQALDPLIHSSVSSTVQTLSGHADTVWAIAISPNQRILASGSFDRTIRLWNVETGSLIRILTGHQDAVRSVAFSPDGRILASGSGDKTIKIWNSQTGGLLRTLVGHSGPVWSVALSPDGQTLASGSYDGAVKVWNFETGTLLYTLPEHYDSVWSVTISPDGKTLASGSYDGTIKIWDLKTGSLRQTLAGHTDAVRSVAISPDGQTLVSGSWDKTIRVWNLATGTVLHTLSGHNDRVLSVAVSPSGQTIASGSLDRTIKIWDLASGQLLRTLSGHSDWVLDVAFSAQGRMLASSSKDRTIKLWRLL